MDYTVSRLLIISDDFFSWKARETRWLSRDVVRVGSERCAGEGAGGVLLLTRGRDEGGSGVDAATDQGGAEPARRGQAHTVCAEGAG